MSNRNTKVTVQKFVKRNDENKNGSTDAFTHGDVEKSPSVLVLLIFQI